MTKPPPPERSEQTDFVIRALGESVKDLIQQLKEKNEKLSQSGFRPTSSTGNTQY